MWVYLYPNNTETELKNAYIWIPFPESIVLDKSSISLTTIWQTEQLTATIEPTISDHSITWSSDDTTIATVSTTGLVTCVTPWECTITATTVNGLTASCSVDDNQWWQPWANTIWYYTMDNDILNHATTGSTFPDGVINTASFSTTRVHGNNTYSLYCNGSTSAYLPADSNYVFWTNDFTISVWVYSETNSWTYTWFISNYNDSFGWDSKQWYRISDRFGSQNKLNFCWNAGSGSTDIWVDGTTNTPIYNDGWHNVVLSRTSGVFNLYLDWNPVYTNSSYTTNWIGKNNRIYLGVNASDSNYSIVYINDVIFENRWWSAQEVSDYYNLTNI